METGEDGSRKGAVASMKVDAAGRRKSLCIYGGGGGGHEWVGARVWGGFWLGAIPLSVSCVVGKREGEEAEVAVSVEWCTGREAAGWARPWTTSVTGERIDYAQKVGLSLHHLFRRPGFGSVSLALP
jgi:hypothetical protein